MKQSSPLSKGSGKLGSVKYSVKKGAQIASEYQPKVSNPNTSDQQNTRSRFKLMSQLAAVMADVIAIKPKGLQTARNLFQKINFDTVQYENDTASINLNKVQITKSNMTMVNFQATRDGSGAEIFCDLTENANHLFDSVVYTAFIKSDEGEIISFASQTVTDDEDGLFAASLPYTNKSVVIYAYGIKFKNYGIAAKFGNLVAPSAEQVAKLLVSSSKNMDAVTLTKTKGLTMDEGVNHAVS